MDLKHKLFGFSGRMRRLDYWLLSIGANISIGIVDAVQTLAFNGGDLAALQSDGNMVSSAISVALNILNLWISVAIMVKRCHDRDKRGWWAAFFLLVPIVGWIWGFIELGFLDGTQGRNRFGASPKGIGGSDEEDLAKVFA
ncbi:DUF805 domain-containing protein [Caulobacter endophyticus]|uniref:DUF805 domain-containing protein n=1 Tax=Caulobacter endophyticus TaxID=2172652 RepID=A0A2T9JGC7_9CAUL|nr:DUF805 domain-containing protein [Caulobacter endophyticus]PVM82716.1 DUF805 domain-containing protein [Caulobacter endophyticus]